MNASKIGKTLRDARNEKGVEISVAARETKIRAFYLEALERGEFDKLPSSAQVRGFLRSYARFLELDGEKLINEAESMGKKEGIDQDENPKGQEERENPAAEIDQAAKQFREIGVRLRKRREMLKLSLEEIEEQIHISDTYLSRIESGDLESFPSPTQARGMLNNYAGFLGLGKEALEQFGDAVQSQFNAAQQDVEDMPPKAITKVKKWRLPRWARRVLSLDVLVGMGLTTVLATIFIWGLGQIVNTRAGLEQEATAPPLAELLLPSSSATMESTATPLIQIDNSGGEESSGEESQATETPITIQVVNPSDVEVQILADQRVWVRVTVDGEIVQEGRLVPGQRYSYSGSEEISVFTGDGAGFRIFLNGQDLGAPGIEGEVIALTFTKAGAATSTITATASVDPNLPSDLAPASATPNPIVDDQASTP